ncbi:hypothetical protein TNCV_1271321 [Trichonephila clavipes]|nr:hypothetical protein TNCV_1271321 [Trichonephila clavipes]
MLSRNNRTPSDELNKLLPKFDISLHLILFERTSMYDGMCRKECFGCSLHLLGLLPQGNHSVDQARGPEQETKDYLTT